MDRLKSLLARLPGVGRRSADRMALAIARNANGYLDQLATTLRDVAAEVASCRLCGAMTIREENPCRYCTDGRRDHRLCCVVEDPSDIEVMERSGAYRGRYHALLGKLAPARGDGMAVDRIQALTRRIRAEGIEEIILALNSDVESDATAHYLAEQLAGLPVRITRLARGIPAGGGLAYADPVTLEAAMKHRTAL
ncbi:MAG TPA: recombination mediator RecR [Kiritimatiellia bacterium]|nr:recombination mediator RecR [Kiritimatiellia bacterium]